MEHAFQNSKIWSGVSLSQIGKDTALGLSLVTMPQQALRPLFVCCDESIEL